MQAYHNNEEIKQKYINFVKNNNVANILLRDKNLYIYDKSSWLLTPGNGNHPDMEHMVYDETILQIPMWIISLENNIYRNYKKDHGFSLNMLKNISLGINLNKIKILFIVFVLNDILNYFDNIKYFDIVVLINEVMNFMNLIDNNEIDTVILKRSVTIYRSMYKLREYYISDKDVDNIKPIFSIMEIALEAMGYNFLLSFRIVNLLIYAAYMVSDIQIIYDKYATKLLELIKECN